MRRAGAISVSLGGWDGDELALLEIYDGTYNPATVYIDELADVRVGQDYLIHDVTDKSKNICRANRK